MPSDSPENTKITREDLLNNVNQSLLKDNIEQFSQLIKQNYTKTVTEQQASGEVWGPQGLVPSFQNVEKEVTAPLSTKDKESFLIKALEQTKPNIVNYLLKDKELESFDLSEKIQKFVNDNRAKQNDPAVNKISATLLDRALTLSSFDKVQAISNLLPNSATVLKIIEPLFVQLRSIADSTMKAKHSGNNDEFNALKDFHVALRGQMKDLLQGKTNDFDKMSDKVHEAANKAKPVLQQNTEGWTAVKNVLLCLTVIGPIIKKLLTGKAWVQNSTTNAVKDATDSFKGLKESFQSMVKEGSEDEAPNADSQSSLGNSQ